MSTSRPTRVLIVLAMTLGSCSGAELTTPGSSSTTTSIANTTTSTSSTTPATSVPGPTTTSTTTVSATTLGLISPTGVPVAVIDEGTDGYLILTPCGFETVLASGEPIGSTTVVLDPGHGGPSDTGAVGANGLMEKEVNLRVAEEVAAILAHREIDAILTRTADYTSPLFVRANLADTLQADLMVSIHHNAPTPGPSEKPGVEIFIQKESPGSARLGGLLWEATRAGLDTFDVEWSAAPDAGVMTVLNTRGDDAYGIIRHPETTTALVELGYISNPPEAELFARPEYAQVAAGSIANAIDDYLMGDEQGSGFVEGRIFNPSPGVGQDVCSDPDLG